MEANAASIEELRKLIEMSGTINMEVFYWWCTALMVIIHAGFLAYEIGASRLKNALAAGVKNILAFAFLMPTFFFFGWWIYLAFPDGFIPRIDDAAAGVPWGSLMGPNLADNANGIFWGAFALFAATTASIMSGAIIERTRMSAFLILAIFLGSVVWILGASWGWHPEGWLTVKWGFHDVGAAGAVHTVAGFFALGVVMNVGARIGKFNADGTANRISGHSVPMSLIGLMLIIVGFFGFLGGCIIYNVGGQWTNIYGQPATLSAFAFNTLMGFSGGLIGAYLSTRDPFWMMSGGLVGIISVAPGLDVYYPPLAFVIGMGTAAFVPLIDKFITNRFKIDDAVGAFAVHGCGGFIGLVVSGIFIAGYPNMAEGVPATNFMGQFGGAVVLAALGFIPGYALSRVLKAFNMLRVPAYAEVRGLDLTEIPTSAYPESVPANGGGNGSNGGHGIATAPAAG